MKASIVVLGVMLMIAGACTMIFLFGFILFGIGFIVFIVGLAASDTPKIVYAPQPMYQQPMYGPQPGYYQQQGSPLFCPRCGKRVEGYPICRTCGTRLF